MREAINTKERFINQWLIAHEHFRLNKLRKIFEALLIMGKHLRVTEEKELELHSRAKTKLINATFYQWIDSYNSRVKYRALVFKAT